ncbi:MAG: ATP-binding protein, partial [Acidobacteriota bacterium]|nr:ATP-binding protein [Acidobacteriota bacterium]
LRAKVAPDELVQEEAEDGLLESLLRSACYCLIRENDLPRNVDALLDVDFPGGRVRPLHARIRLVFRDENDREEHCCLRAIERKNAVAFQARLKAAMTGAGIDRSLKFRRLIIVRRAPLPQGTKMGILVEGFRGAGGLLVHPEEDELRTLWALHELRREQRTEFLDWLKSVRPASHLPFLAAAMAMFRAAAGESADGAVKNGSPVPAWPEIRREEPSAANGIPEMEAGGERLLLGYADSAAGGCEPVMISPGSLTKHTVGLGGAGSGKTVLVKRLVEEAAILGIPSIVIDCATDMAGLGDKRPLRPANWTAEEAAQAERYWANAEVQIWTPGRQAGNPLLLDSLPDLAGLADDPEALDQAIDMVRESLEDILTGGRADSTLPKRGVLAAALRHFAKRGGGGMNELIALLADLPEAAGAEIGGAPRLAAGLADGLRARMAIDPLLGREGKRLDPGSLFGLKPTSARTRISVISLSGLESTASRCRFMSQMAMTLFAWIRKNPAAPGKPLTGLFVLDEAKDFVPTVRATPCSAGLIRLAAQARKYGLGLIFASQEPKSIDCRITANVSTQFFGRFNAPASIDTARDLLRDKGGEGDDIARLPTGRFYVASPELPSPRRIAIPLCVSDHTVLTEKQVLARAASTRK